MTMNIKETIKDMLMPEAEVQSLRDMFVEGLKDVYYAENKLYKSLGEMVEASSSESLKEGFEDHRQETAEHVERLKKIFGMLDMTPQGKQCEAIEGLVTEADEIIGETDAGGVRDAGLIYAAQGVEHYEMARYTTLHAWAVRLGLEDAATLLSATLKEETLASKHLTQLAQGGIDESAMKNKVFKDKSTTATSRK